MSTQWPGMWLGRPGSMIALPGYVGSMETKREASATYKPLLANGGLVGHVPPGRPMRTWDVKIPAVTPDEVAPLRELLEAEVGPWWWVSPQARATNVMSPSMCDLPGLVQAGNRPLAEGGVVVRSWMTGSGGGAWLGTVPVQQGIPVTGSVYASSASAVTVSLRWLDIAGVVLDAAQQSAPVSAADLTRVSVTATPPPAATSARLQISGASVVARPAVSWTDAPTEWGHGQGAQAVHVAGWSSSLTRAALGPDPLSRLEEISFTVQEVRDA